MVELSQNEDFLQKTALKTVFLADTKLDQLTHTHYTSAVKRLSTYLFNMLVFQFPKERHTYTQPKQYHFFKGLYKKINIVVEMPVEG